jgi:hypothetical protein
MEKHLKQMRINSEEFRLNCIRKLRASAEVILTLSERVPEALFVSLCQSSIHRFQSLVNTQWSSLMAQVQLDEQAKTSNKQALRPNLANPVCRAELLALGSSEETRANAAIVRMKSVYETLIKSVDEAGSGFAVKLENNMRVLLLIFDAQLIYEDFAMLPGDGEVERKRTNIKRLARKKMSGKAGVDVGPRGYRKRWKGVDLKLLFYFNPEAPQSPEIESYKDIRQKQTLKRREESFQEFCSLFKALRSSRESELQSLLAAEEQWVAYWRTAVEQLRVRKV